MTGEHSISELLYSQIFPFCCSVGEEFQGLVHSKCFTTELYSPITDVH